MPDELSKTAQMFGQPGSIDGQMTQADPLEDVRAWWDEDAEIRDFRDHARRCRLPLARDRFDDLQEDPVLVKERDLRTSFRNNTFRHYCFSVQTKDLLLLHD